MDFYKEYFNLGYLDTLSYQDTLIHRLDGRTKVIATLIFVVTVVSFPKHEFTGLIPFAFFPVLTFALGDIPVWFILKKVFLVSLFALFVGIFNPMLDTQTAMFFFGLPISGGWLSFFSILLKFLLTMTAVLLLISTTSLPGIAHALGKMGIPEVFIAQLLFLYRYIFVLMEETMRMIRARDLRSFGRKGQGINVFIQLAGTLFIRTIERAERIYQAMLSRGFNGTIYSLKKDHLERMDFVYLALVGGGLALCRMVNLVEILGRQVERFF
jgi:cobalt/nickel transport system permease protein